MKVHGLFPLNDFQDRLTAGRLPETEANRLPEGELILTINIYFPSTVEKVSFYLYFVTSSHLSLNGSSVGLTFPLYGSPEGSTNRKSHNKNHIRSIGKIEAKLKRKVCYQVLLEKDLC